MGTHELTATMPLSPVLARKMASELRPDERIVWVGQPTKRFIVPPEGWFVISYWLGTCIWNSIQAIQAPAPLALVMIQSMLFSMVLGIVPFAFLVAWLARRRAKQIQRNTLYTLTARRLIVARRSGRGLLTLRSFRGDELNSMKRVEGKSGSGNLVFDPAPDNPPTFREELNGIEQVREVEDLIRRTLRLPAASD